MQIKQLVCMLYLLFSLSVSLLSSFSFCHRSFNHSLGVMGVGKASQDTSGVAPKAKGMFALNLADVCWGVFLGPESGGECSQGLVFALPRS